MKRFHVNQRPDLKFIEVVKKQEKVKVAQINEVFEVGTSDGVAHGKAGDYLFMDGSALSVVRGEDFDTLYEVVKKVAKKAVKKEEEKTPEKRVAKKSSKEIYQPKPAKVVAKKAPKKVVKKVVKKTKKKK